jgi:thiol-disulfide isomerase/thioredoxin
MNLSKALTVTLLMGFLFCVIFVLTKEQTPLPQPGEAATDFSYPDKDGNDVSLSDFVGSVVYVDVWATWCGPCRAEMPFLHDLESEYSDKNVTFIGVSVDEEKNRQAWLDMMVDKDMKGVQLFADGWSQITKDYAINYIPRFMLFDTEGNVADLDAASPSSDDIRSSLDALLAE